MVPFTKGAILVHVVEPQPFCSIVRGPKKIRLLGPGPLGATELTIPTKPEGGEPGGEGGQGGNRLGGTIFC